MRFQVFAAVLAKVEVLCFIRRVVATFRRVTVRSFLGSDIRVESSWTSYVPASSAEIKNEWRLTSPSPMSLHSVQNSFPLLLGIRRACSPR
jgi:hypothetical protein